MVAILEKGEFNTDFHPMVDFSAASPLRARIAQSFTLPTVADKPASPVRDVSKREACPTKSSFIADQDRATIVKSSTLPHDLAPRVTSPAADEGSMQHNISELTALCTSLQRQYSELQAKFQAQEEEIVKLKDRVNVLEDREGVATKQSGDDTPIKGRSINEGEAAAERISNDSEEIARVLTSIDAATVEVLKFLMYPRFLTKCLRMTQFVQITHTHQYAVPFHTKKLFSTLRVNSPSFSGRIVPLFDTMLVHQGEGSCTPTEPHHTPFAEVESSYPTTSSILLPSIPTAPIPTVTQTDTTPIIQYSRRARIAESSALLTVADEPASPVRDDSQGKACPTDSGL
nr:hypothetical protein [Tanacetum cinerariifolium]